MSALSRPWQCQLSFWCEERAVEQGGKGERTALQRTCPPELDARPTPKLNLLTVCLRMAHRWNRLPKYSDPIPDVEQGLARHGCSVVVLIPLSFSLDPPIILPRSTHKRQNKLLPLGHCRRNLGLGASALLSSH